MSTGYSSPLGPRLGMGARVPPPLGLGAIMEAQKGERTATQLTITGPRTADLQEGSDMVGKH